MNENYNNQDIEKLIFGGTLLSGEIEPSEKFWNKAYEGILQRENHINLKRAARWRTGFFIMSAVALSMAFYLFYMQHTVNGIQRQLAVIENTPVNTSQQNTNQTTVTTTTEKSTVSNVPTTKVTGQKIQQPDITPAPITQHSIATAPSLVFKKLKEANYAYSNHTSNRTTSIASNTSPAASNASNSPNNLAHVINKTNNKEDISTANTVQSISNTGSQLLINNKAAQTAQTINDSAPKNTQIVSAQKKTDSLAAQTSGLDSVGSTYAVKKPVTFAHILSKASVSAFYAPGLTEDFLSDKNNDPTNTITAQTLKTQQDGDASFAIGFRLDYDISDRWTIQTGAYYSDYSYKIRPTVIYAQQQENGQVGYSIPTSSGTVFLPNSAIPAHLGDSIQVKGSSSRAYISIPLQVKYTFAESTRFKFYIDGGFSINIANYQQSAINWENTSFQEGDVNVKNIYGLNSVHYSYNLGLGVAYLVKRGLSIYTEPFVNGSVTSINKNTPVITYPYYFGWSLGLTYHF